MALHSLVDQLRIIRVEIAKVEKRIVAWHRDNDVSRRLATIPGIGPITASAIAAAVPDATLFRSGRQFAAWLGLTPRAHSSGGRELLLGISKQGDGYIRCLLVIGATLRWRHRRFTDGRTALELATQRRSGGQLLIGLHRRNGPSARRCVYMAASSAALASPR